MQREFKQVKLLKQQIMKKAVKDELENLVKILDDCSYRKHYHLLILSHCFDKRHGDWFAVIQSSIISTPVFERVNDLCRKYDLMMFFSAHDDIVRLHIQ